VGERLLARLRSRALPSQPSRVAMGPGTAHQDPGRGGSRQPRAAHARAPGPRADIRRQQP
jgi:hypothetical protein